MATLERDHKTKLETIHNRLNENCKVNQKGKGDPIIKGSNLLAPLLPPPIATARNNHSKIFLGFVILVVTSYL